MRYELYIGDQAYSSWSLRAWLMLDRFGLPFEIRKVGVFSGDLADQMRHLAPARLVPTLRTPEGTVVGESLAIAETLAERHPEAGLWPSDPAARATARWLCAEMASGFAALRRECAMNLLHVYAGFRPSPQVIADLTRIQELWSHARDISGARSGPLFGGYSLADAFFAPVAARIVGHRLPVAPPHRRYCELLLSDPSVRRWRADGLEAPPLPPPYPVDLATEPWPF